MDESMRVAELAPGRAAGWLGESFRMFRARPLQWIGLTAGWVSITFALILIPFLGGVIANFLQPVFFASFAIAAYKQQAGERIAMADLFSGFRRNVRSLINLGALLLLAEIAIFAVMAALGFPIASEGDQPFTVSEYLEQMQGKEWILAVGFILTVTVKGALWFAPPLIAFHGMSTSHAMRWSVYAALANIGAMLVYGMVLMALFFVALLPWALGLVVFMPVMAISTYVGYREVFEPMPD
jgi:membrane-anchored glycerophosphoryl diester phosphodiesterase (GDPDase)